MTKPAKSKEPTDKIAPDAALEDDTPAPTMINGVYVGPAAEPKAAPTLVQKLHAAFHNQAQIDVLMEVLTGAPQGSASTQVETSDTAQLTSVIASLDNLNQTVETLAATLNEMSAGYVDLRDRLSQAEALLPAQTLEPIESDKPDA